MDIPKSGYIVLSSLLALGHRRQNRIETFTVWLPILSLTPSSTGTMPQSVQDQGVGTRGQIGAFSSAAFQSQGVVTSGPLTNPCLLRAGETLMFPAYPSLVGRRGVIRAGQV